jgi:hypothetical protein
LFHLLRKRGVIEVNGDRIQLNSRSLSTDGRRFAWGQSVFHLDRDLIEQVRYGPGGSPYWSQVIASERSDPD